MHESNPTAAKLQQAKKCNRSRLFHPPIISLIYAALVWTLAALGLVRYPQGGDDLPELDGAADLGELTGGRPAIKRLTAAELDERAPLTPQEEAQFGPSKGDRTRRAVYQATLLLTQGGARERFMSSIGAILGVCVRTTQRAHKWLEKRGLSRRRYRKTSPAWNLANSFRFLLRGRQLPIFLKNVAQGRKNLIQETNTPKNPGFEAVGMWKSCRARPSNHPPEFLAAWKARRRANHPPEMRQRYEEKAEFYKYMRGWRPTAAQKHAAIVTAELRARARAKVKALTRDERERERADPREFWAARMNRTQAAELPQAITWAAIDDEPRELVVVATLQLRPRPQAAQ